MADYIKEPIIAYDHFLENKFKYNPALLHGETSLHSSTKAQQHIHGTETNSLLHKEEASAL